MEIYLILGQTIAPLIDDNIPQDEEISATED